MRRRGESVFAPALGAPGGRDRSAGHAKTDAPEPHLSGQPVRRHVSAGRREGAPSSRSACRCGEAATNVSERSESRLMNAPRCEQSEATRIA